MREWHWLDIFTKITNVCHDSVEHNDVQVVAVNDPFIEPKYAVSACPIGSHID